MTFKGAACAAKFAAKLSPKSMRKKIRDNMAKLKVSLILLLYISKENYDIKIRNITMR